MNRIQAINPPTRVSDGDLLARHLAERDDGAFAELVVRHGAMVYGVCLRRLGRTQDAEDAFQAVFLALARQAAELVDRPTVGPWLYTVARRVSGKALRSRSRRRWVFWGKTPEPVAKAPAEVDVDLDAALATLSEQERSAVVLCHLEGLSRSEAAAALGCPEGTLSARLARALEKLRRKLGKPPLAILAGTMLVALPDPLPASTVGLVRHLRDGTLDDWAPPHVLDLYRKALPMRLLDRFGPAATVVAALLVMLGAAFGWHLITAQPPTDAKQPPQAAVTTAQPPAKKKSFAAAVDEVQQQKALGKKEEAAVVQILVVGRTQSDARQGPRGYWDIKISEVINGERVEHTTSTWPALVPLLKQIADSGPKTISASIGPGPATRLDANHLVNVCKRAGFTAVDYRGPALFLGREGESRAASVDDVPSVRLNIDLTKSNDYLPDWTNRWAALDKALVYFGRRKVEVTPALDKAINLAGGPSGPAAELLESLENEARSGGQKEVDSEPVPVTELAKQIDAQQRREGGAQTSMILQRQGAPGPTIPSQSSLIIRQRFRRGEAATTTQGNQALWPLVDRAARHAGGRIDLQVGSSDGGAIVNPLHVNAVLNACRRAGLGEVYYTGQKIITGREDRYDLNLWPGQSDSLPLVKIVLSLRHLEGDLPDESNGWVEVPVGPQNRTYVVKASERERLLESLPPRRTPDGYDQEVARLLKLPLNEFERELARKPSLLRNQWRKRVEEARAKTQPK